MSDSGVYVEVAEGVARVTIDRPPVNALSAAAWQELAALAQTLGEDPKARVVVLTGAGERAFCAGADLRERAAVQAKDHFEDRGELVERSILAWSRLGLPVICAVNGPAVGGGVTLAALCDYRISVDRAHFSMPEIDRGAIGGGGVALRRLGIREGVVRRLLFTGERLGAEEALAVGLVDRVVAPGGLEREVGSLAATIAGKARPALVAMKAAVLAAEREAYWADGLHATQRFAVGLFDEANG